jgi:hypothetical protein
MELLLGKPVLYRVSRNSARAAVIVGVRDEDTEFYGAAVVDLYVYPGLRVEGYVEAGVVRGLNVGQWLYSGEVVPDSAGCPDYRALEATP